MNFNKQMFESSIFFIHVCNSRFLGELLRLLGIRHYIFFHVFSTADFTTFFRKQ